MSIFYVILALLIISIILTFSIYFKKKIHKAKLDTKELYYDMHTHILPGLDHGAQDMEMAVSMIQREAEEGIGHIVLTPHYFSGKDQKEKIDAQYEKLCEEVKQRNIPVVLYKGNEMRGNEQNLQDLEENRVTSLGDTSYVLVEFHTEDSFHHIYHTLQQIQLSGYRPIVAHIERYEALRKKESVAKLIQMGAYLQVNAGSFCKKHLQKYLITLAKEDMVHFIGSDSHDLSKRPPGIRCGTEVLKKKLSQRQYEKICFRNPERILNNDYI